MSGVKWLRKLGRRTQLVAFLLCPLVLGVVFALWRGAVFQSAECFLHDQIITWRAPSDAGAPGIVVVGITEKDIRQYGWALDDQTLARVLDLIAAQQPSAIGLDLYRDLPEPRDGRFSQVLSNSLLAHTNLVCIYGGPDDAPIPPPPAVADQADRIGFNAFPADKDGGVVRRALLFPQPDTGEQPVYSLALQLVRHHLAPTGVPLGWDPAAPERFRLGKSVLRKFQPSDGPYVRDENVVGFQMQLDYRGSREVVALSLHDILAGKARTNELTGKIVLIGIMGSSVNDFVNTPLRMGQYGVTLHAQVVDQLLRLAAGSSVPARYWPEWLEALWILLLALLGKQLGFVAREPWRFTVWLLVATALLAGIHVWALWHDWWPPFVPALAAFVGCAVLVMSYMAWQEKVMRGTLMSLFSQQVSHDIAEDLWARREEFLEDGRPKAQKLTVTVLFTDLKGFSTVSETMDPVELYAWLNLYLSDMADLVLQHHGVLKQFTGDGLLALFGVPTPHTSPEDLRRDAERAVRCALAMGRRMVQLHEVWRRTGQPTVSMRVGIYTGSVAAGSIGSANRCEYAVIGDVVNTASRLESYDKTLADPDLHPLRCRILIGAPTHDLVAGLFETQEIGLLKVKGKQIEVAVFQVHGELAAPLTKV